MADLDAPTPYWHTERGFAGTKDFLADFARLAPDARVVIDGGAYDGGSARQFLSLYPNAAVHSFEPTPDTFAKLSAARSEERHILVNAALGPAAGMVELREFQHPAGNSLLPFDPKALAQVPEGMTELSQAQARVVSLDDYCAEQGVEAIDLMKLDLQGGELGALQGAHRLLSSRAFRIIYTEVLFTRVYLGQTEFSDVQAHLSGYGYRLFDFYNFSYGPNGQLRWGDALFLAEP